MNIKTLEVVSLSEIFPKSWGGWIFDSLSENAPFTWGDTDHTLVNAESFSSHLRETLNYVMESEESISGIIKTQEQAIFKKLEELESKNVLIDLEN